MPVPEIYVRVSVHYDDDPRVVALARYGDRAGLCRDLHQGMIRYCRRNLTDGFVPDEEIGRLVYPLSVGEGEQLVGLLADVGLVAPVADGNGDSPSQARAMAVASQDDGNGHGPGQATAMAPGWQVANYAKWNGTRAEIEQLSAERSTAGRKGAHSRWLASASQVASVGHRSVDGKTWPESETETESSAGVVNPGARPPAHTRARPRADDDHPPPGDAPGGDDDLDGRIVIMLAAHGHVINREQARGVRLRILGGRRVANPAGYVSSALATAEGARKWAPSRVAMPPRGLDPVTATRAAQLRGAGGYETLGDGGPRPAQPTLDDAERADLAHRGADTARKLLHDRERPAAAEASAPPGQLHGATLAAAQLAESRAARGTLQRLDDHDDDDEPDDDEQETDDDQFGDEDQADDFGDDDDDDRDFEFEDEPDRPIEDVELPGGEPPF
jgi:hypothetical protein